MEWEMRVHGIYPLEVQTVPGTAMLTEGKLKINFSLINASNLFVFL